MTYKSTQDNKDWIDRTGSHATRPLLRVSSQPAIDLDLVEAKRKRRAHLAKTNAPLEPEPTKALAMVLQQLGIEHEDVLEAEQRDRVWSKQKRKEAYRAKAKAVR